jgi:hypothetical protein
VPAGPTGTPGESHTGSPGFEAFHSREVQRVTLVLTGLDAGPGEHVVDVAPTELAVSGKGAHREVHVSAGGVSVAPFDDSLYVLDHLGDVLRGVDERVGLQDPQTPVCLEELVGRPTEPESRATAGSDE